jgi:hypothetical protein
MGMIFMPMEYLNENVYKTPATQHYPNQQHVTYYSNQTIVNPSALKKIIKKFRLTKCINKTTLILTVNSFVES